ncbi:MAG: M23 family metallopeptidase [Spirochaetales bacterium]|nr:M23 family metallopeptidase [Spirochaetales bacterium]
MSTVISNNPTAAPSGGGGTQVISKICQTARILLQEKESRLIRLDNQVLINGESSSYLLSVSLIDEAVLVLDEQIRSGNNQSLSHYHWVLTLSGSQPSAPELSDTEQPGSEPAGSREPAGWALKSARRNSEDLHTELLHLELFDLFERLEGLRNGSLPPLDVPSPLFTGSGSTGLSENLKNRSSRVFTLAAAALVMSGLFLTVFITTMQYGRMLKTVLILSDTISESSSETSGSIKALSKEVSRINTEVSGLKQDVIQEQEAFVFNKKQTSMNLRWLASKFPRSSYSRTNAYLYIADKIDQAQSYGEVVYQLSRLPENNEQAETIMATDRDNPMSMKYFSPVFPEMILPVRSEDGTEGTEAFMISSGYIERRLSPLGYGGVRPHHAVDLINLDNIVRITEDNEIVRDQTRAGDVQAVYDGVIASAGFDWVYGWNAEVQHPLLPSVAEKFPTARFWTTFYAHMESADFLSEGMTVEKGESFGKIGSSGRSTGPHLHFEVRIYHPRGGESGPLGNFDKVNPYRKDEEYSLGS